MKDREGELMRQAENRLEQWARDLHYPGFNVMPSENMLQRRRLDRRNVAAGGQPTPYEIIEDDQGSVACPKDGGLGAMVDRMAGAVQRSRECREVQEWFNDAPDLYRAIVKRAYVRPSPSEDSLTDEEAAKRIGVPRSAYWRYRRAMLLSLAGFLCLAGVPAKAA